MPFKVIVVEFESCESAKCVVYPDMYDMLYGGARWGGRKGGYPEPLNQ